MKVLRRVLALSALSLAVSFVPVHAEGTGSHPKATVNWQQRDTAVYVISTLNLVGRSRGKTITALLKRQHVAYLDVYADTEQADLYFVELKRDDGALVAAVAYQMGWTKPKRIVWSMGHFIPSAPTSIVQAYRNDEKTLIGTFTSTLPQ